MGGHFVYGNTISNSLVYTVDGKLPTESDDKTSLIVGGSLGRVEIEETKQAIDYQEN